MLSVMISSLSTLRYGFTSKLCSAPTHGDLLLSSTILMIGCSGSVAIWTLIRFLCSVCANFSYFGLTKSYIILPVIGAQDDFITYFEFDSGFLLINCESNFLILHFNPSIFGFISCSLEFHFPTI